MTTCFLCKQKFNNVKILFNHFDFFHPEHKFDSFFSAENNCLRSFSLKNSFRKHLLTHTEICKPQSNIFSNINEFTISVPLLSDSSSNKEKLFVI